MDKIKGSSIKVEILNSKAKLRLTQALALAMILGSNLLASGQAAAAVLLGNYPPVNDNGLPPSFNGTRQKAIGFTLPSGTNYLVDSLELRLGNYNSATDTPLLQLFADSNLTSSNPNNANLTGASFNNPSSSSDAIANFIFTPNGGLVLLASTRYWLLVDATAGDFEWRVDNSISPFGNAPTGLVTFNSYQGSPDNGVSYGTSGTFNSFQINATATLIPFGFNPLSGLALIGGLYLAKKLLKAKTND
jgi:hypothetical protein